jgi:hypothetical protein
MIVARLSLPGQSAPGPHLCRAWRQRERKHIIGQHGARYPPRDTPAPALHRPRADRGPPQRTAAPRCHQVNLGAQPAVATARYSAAGDLARQRRPSGSLHQTQRIRRIGRHICQCQNPRIWSPAGAERPPTRGVHIGGSSACSTHSLSTPYAPGPPRTSPGVFSTCLSSKSACSVTSEAWTSSSSAAGRRTSPPGWPGAAPGRPGWT